MELVFIEELVGVVITESIVLERLVFGQVSSGNGFQATVGNRLSLLVSVWVLHIIWCWVSGVHFWVPSLGVGVMTGVS